MYKQWGSQASQKKLVWMTDLFLWPVIFIFITYLCVLLFMPWLGNVCFLFLLSFWWYFRPVTTTNMNLDFSSYHWCLTYVHVPVYLGNSIITLHFFYCQWCISEKVHTYMEVVELICLVFIVLVKVYILPCFYQN